MNILRHVMATLATALTLRDKSLHTKVIKAGLGCNIAAGSRGKSVHETWHKAGMWIPDRDIRILHILIAEQSEITLYVDIEVSLHPHMLRANEDEQLFRYKYAGPAIQWHPSFRGAQYSGSNTTNSVISLAPGIVIKKDTPIYVHLDVINWSHISIKDMMQDVLLYYLDE